MYKSVLVLASYCTLAACATAQPQTAEKQVCTTEVEESTGSRVEGNKVCRPAEGE